MPDSTAMLNELELSREVSAQLRREMQRELVFRIRSAASQLTARHLALQNHLREGTFNQANLVSHENFIEYAH